MHLQKRCSSFELTMQLVNLVNLRILHLHFTCNNYLVGETLQKVKKEELNYSMQYNRHRLRLKGLGMISMSNPK